MRRRLKEVLERAHYIVSGDEREGSVDDEDLEFEEEVIGLDYLDEVGEHMHVHVHVHLHVLTCTYSSLPTCIEIVDEHFVYTIYCTSIYNVHVQYI